MGETTFVKDFNFMGSAFLRHKGIHPIPRRHQCRAPPMRAKIRIQMVLPSTYSAKITTDIPLYEAPGASFDQYLENKPRVFSAIFPDKRRSQQLNEDEWRIHMLPIEILFLTARPVVDMRLRCKSNGKEYPPGVPSRVSKVLELDITRWELQGLQDVGQPSHFSLGVKGALYPDRYGGRNRLKGLLEMKISVVVPPLLALIPDDALRSVSESVLKRLIENMKDKVDGSLLADYSRFRKERQKSLV
ncbi:hypothetical protein Dimus_022118 [Dionaea muscipula]